MRNIFKTRTNRYFVAYTCKVKGQPATSWAEVTLGHAIRNSGDVLTVTRSIETEHGGDVTEVVVSNWKRFEN